MDFVTITSRSNEKIKEYGKLLSSAKARREHGMFVLEGLRLCADCAGSGFSVRTAFVTESVLEKGGARLEQLLSAADQVFQVSPEVAEKLSDTVSPQGVFCTVQMPKESRPEFHTGGKYVLLDCVQNPQNLGAIARTAEALGVDGLAVFSGCDIYNPKALRASMGSLLRLPVSETEDLAKTVRDIGSKVLTFAAVPDPSAEPITAQDFSRGAAAVIGNEANGVSEAVLSVVQKQVTVPMRGNAESFNAAAAATITMWEMMK